MLPTPQSSLSVSLSVRMLCDLSQVSHSAFRLPPLRCHKWHRDLGPFLCNDVPVDESCLRTTSESISGSHCGQGKAEARGVRERRTVVTCDALMITAVRARAAE